MKYRARKRHTWPTFLNFSKFGTEIRLRNQGSRVTPPPPQKQHLHTIMDSIDKGPCWRLGACLHCSVFWLSRVATTMTRDVCIFVKPVAIAWNLHYFSSCQEILGDKSAKLLQNISRRHCAPCRSQMLTEVRHACVRCSSMTQG